MQDEPNAEGGGGGPLAWLHAAAQTPFTSLAVFACTGIWVGVQFSESLVTPADFLRWGVADIEQVRAGAWWALFTAEWGHRDLWHVALNVYWLWMLGRPIEQELGSLRLAALCALSGAFASYAELGVSGSTGMGASGMVYALFGYIWFARPRSATYSLVVPERVVRLFLVWFVICILLTEVGWLNIANAAHAGGLAVGCAVGWLAMAQRLRALALVVAATALATVPWLWRPWSPQWQYETGWEAQVSGDLEGAERHYRALIDVGGDELWARAQLALLLHVGGRDDEARAELALVEAQDKERAAGVRAALEFVDECRIWATRSAALVSSDLREAVLAASQGKLRVARELYAKCLEADPEDDAAWAGLLRAAYNDPRCVGKELETVLDRLEDVPPEIAVQYYGPAELLPKLRARLVGKEEEE
ncbi:MAG: rhomboid family intramembrane serine protease [Planctomycetaceae bacterium]|nr:rhomboid family intramembrane serine protease [Planctomycetaceae bacterium]